jgi:hypothetical protein
MGLEPTITTVKTLFALSGNACAFTGCEVVLTSPKWRKVRGEMAHIRGERFGSARFDPAMTDDERRAFENLMLLCPNHHTEIDDLDPDAYTVERLIKMKEDHESRGNPVWAPEEQLESFATLLIVEYRRSVVTPEPDEPVEAKRLAIAQELDGGIAVVNLGPGTIKSVHVTVADGKESFLHLQEIQGFSIEQDHNMVVAYEAPGTSHSGPQSIVLAVSYVDPSGQRTIEDFEITVPHPH